MTNELKPCPFCGEKACIEVFDSHMNFPKFRAECSTCEINLRLKQTRDDAIEAWNTRQSGFDWKPIEELTEEIIQRHNQILLFQDNSYLLASTGYDDFGGSFIVTGDFESNEYIYEIERNYTHYTLLTPPQTNQS